MSRNMNLSANIEDVATEDIAELAHECIDILKQEKHPSSDVAEVLEKLNAIEEDARAMQELLNDLYPRDHPDYP